MRIHLTCPVCEKAFDRYRSGMRERNYCSKACAYAAIRQRNLAPIVVDGEIAKVPLRTRDGSIIAYAVIDAADADFVGQWPWHLNSEGYASRSAWEDGKYTTIRLHRVLLGLEPGDPLEGDHVDHDRLNDRRSNLRVVPKRKQGENRLPNRGASSKYRGVHWHKRNGKWVARIAINGRRICLGSFTSEEAAGEAARMARKAWHSHAVD